MHDWFQAERGPSLLIVTYDTVGVSEMYYCFGNFAETDTALQHFGGHLVVLLILLVFECSLINVHSSRGQGQLLNILYEL